MTVIPIRPPDSRHVRFAGELAEVEEVRAVPLTATQAGALEAIGVTLAKLGADKTATLLLGIAAAWKVAS